MSEFMLLKIEAPAEYEEELTMLLFLHGEEYLVEGIAQSGSVKG